MATTAVERFVAVLSQQFAAGQLRHDDLACFAVDGIAPGVAVEPTTLTQLQIFLTEAQKNALAVIPAAGGQHLAAGNLPSAYDVALSLARLDRIVDHEPADMTVTVEAGVRLRALNARLAQHGQFLPLDPPCGAEATIGGVLAANAYGPLRHAFGTARDWLIGTRVIHADGAVSKSGGRVVKNVTGYDMHKLYVGSLGTLGVIAEATFKLAPLPHTQRTLTAAFESARDACAFVLAAHEAGLALHAAEVLSPAAARPVADESHWFVLARVAGGPAAVERSLRDLRRLTSIGVRDDDALWQAWSREFRPAALSLRASVLPSSVAAMLTELERSLEGAAVRLSATVAAGVIRTQIIAGDGAAVATVERARETVARHAGALVVDAAPPLVKQQLDTFGPPRPDFAIMRRLKEQLDPQGTLAPGRFVGRL